MKRFHSSDWHSTDSHCIIHIIHIIHITYPVVWNVFAFRVPLQQLSLCWYLGYWEPSVILNRYRSCMESNTAMVNNEK